MTVKKETIKPPTQKSLKDASKELKTGSSAGGRVLAEQSVAKKEGIISTARKGK